MSDLKAPFVYFGGKSRVANIVWDALGDVKHYVEPFFGSGAVLLARPEYHEGGAETVNDIDHWIANFWRSVKNAPNAVAQYADWPVNEADLHARHRWLWEEGRKRIEDIDKRHDLYDEKVAGWWLWGTGCWFGRGWCDGTLQRQMPYLTGAHGIFKKSLRGEGQLEEYVGKISDRLKYVRVTCGDWKRVCARSLQKAYNTSGYFLDPPYAKEGRDKQVYIHDGGEVYNEVREWAIENGERKDVRIVLCGYESDHDEEMPRTWEKVRWSAKRAFPSKDGKPNENRHRETLWLSPHCVRRAPTLFDEEKSVETP